MSGGLSYTCVIFMSAGQEAQLMLPGGLLYAESQGTIEACVVLSEQPVSDVMLNLTTMDGTALGTSNREI